MTEQWIPNYIRRNIEYRPHEILTAKEFNAILNLIITQGDYNSRWLEYLTEHGIPDAIADISVEQLKEALTETVKDEVRDLAAAVVNKTSLHLEQPLFSVLNFSVQKDMLDLRDVLRPYGIEGNFCAASGLVDASAAYPTLLDLQSLQYDGHTILPVSTDNASLDDLSSEVITTKITAAKAYIDTNLDSTNVFVYPDGTLSDTVVDTVGTVFTYAINKKSSNNFLDSDSIMFGNTRLQIPVLYITGATTLDDVQTVIDEVVNKNYYCILAVDTSKTEYTSAALMNVLDYIKGTVGKFLKISDALALCESTLNNRIYSIKINTLSNCYIDFKDANGNDTSEKYIHW